MAVKRKLVFMALCMLFVTTVIHPHAHADVYPPEGALKVPYFAGPVNMYYWVYDNTLYVHYELHEPTTFTIASIVIVQDNREHIINHYEVSGSSLHYSGNIYSSDTFILWLPSDLLDFSAPFILRPNQIQVVTDIPVLDYAIVLSPNPGIWKSPDHVVSMYLQIYETGSCVLVVTMGNGVYTAFLDESYTDGINALDVDGEGYALSLDLSSDSSGTLSVMLPAFGLVTTPVSLTFEAK